MTMEIAGRRIGPDQQPYIIAEMSGNHNQSLSRALEIVEAAAKAGAHAIKLQTYTADSMTLPHNDGEFFISDEVSLWKGESLHALYQKAHTPWEWHEPIMERATKLGLGCFSTPFDEKAVDLLESINVPAYKIASFENVHIPLIRKVAATGKPMIMSTGMASVAELDDAVTAARAAGCRDLVLLKCTSTYPAEPENTHLRTIPHMRELFGCSIGLSDHTMGVGTAVAAVALGAVMIEKHFTLRRADGGVDSTFSMEPEEMAQLVMETSRAWQSLGYVHYGPTEAERASVRFRRSLYVTKDLRPGDVLTTDNVRAIRPGLGLAPKHFEDVLGCRVIRAVSQGTPRSWSLLK